MMAEVQTGPMWDGRPWDDAQYDALKSVFDAGVELPNERVLTSSGLATIQDMHNPNLKLVSFELTDAIQAPGDDVGTGLLRMANHALTKGGVVGDRYWALDGNTVTFWGYALP